MEKKVNKKQTFMEGVMTILFAQIIVKVLGLLYRLVITNVDGFGDEGNGLYGAGYQIYTLLLAFASIGVPSAIAKLVSERIALGKNKEAHDIFKVALMLFGAIGLTGALFLFFGAELIATKWIGNPAVTGVMKALSPAIFFVAIAAVIRGYFNGMYNMKATSNSQILEQFFKSAFTIILVLLIRFLASTNPNVISRMLNVSEANVTEGMAVAANFASTLAAFCSFIYLFKFYNKRKKEIWKDINEATGTYEKHAKKDIVKTILKFSIPISLASIISAINRNIDTFTVIGGLKKRLTSQMFGTTEMITAEATRLYGILSGKIDMLIGLPTALNIAFSTALVPTISEAMAKKDEKTARRRIAFSIRTTLLIALPCAVGMAVLAEPILTLLFPNAVAVEAPMLLKLSSLVVIFTLMNQTLSGALQGLGKVMVPAMGLAIGALAKVVVNVLLIPAIGVNGAAIGSIVCSLVAMIINIVFLHRSLKLNMDYKQGILKPLTVTLIMGIMAMLTYKGVLMIINRTSLATLMAIIMAIIVYFFGVILFGVFDRDDYHMLPYGDKIYRFLEKLKLVKYHTTETK